MPTVRFRMTSALDPAALMDVLTDFGPTRPQQWPTIDADHFQVHSLGDTWAEVTEGTAAAWEHARYDWDAQRRARHRGHPRFEGVRPGRWLDLPAARHSRVAPGSTSN